MADGKDHGLASGCVYRLRGDRSGLQFGVVCHGVSIAAEGASLAELARNFRVLAELDMVTSRTRTWVLMKLLRETPAH